LKERGLWYDPEEDCLARYWKTSKREKYLASSQRLWGERRNWRFYTHQPISNRNDARWLLFQ
jgi:hypothetical protein